MSVARVLPSRDRLIQRIQSFIAEAREFDQGIFGLKTVPMVVALSTAVVNGQQTFTVPYGYTFRLVKVLPHIGFEDPAALTLAQAATYNPSGALIFTGGSVKDLILGHLLNTRIGLKTTYNKIKFFDSGMLPLANLSRFGGGGKAMPSFGMPNIIRGGTVVELNVAAASANILPTDPATVQLGVHLIGDLIPEDGV